jgi:hypothetical protein
MILTSNPQPGGPGSLSVACYKSQGHDEGILSHLGSTLGPTQRQGQKGGALTSICSRGYELPGSTSALPCPF